VAASHTSCLGNFITALVEEPIYANLKESSNRRLGPDVEFAGASLPPHSYNSPRLRLEEANKMRRAKAIVLSLHTQWLEM
ncbi:hypothetical protein LSUB1_G008270, partial [Lachnellula subtilissima]